MKRIMLLLVGVLVLTVATFGQTVPCSQSSSFGSRVCTDAQTISTSGGQITVKSNGGMVPSFEETISGAPSTVSIVIQGCGVNGTCEVLDTYTTTANAIRSPSVVKAYTYYYLTATWTGGPAVSVEINTVITSARGASSLPPGWTTNGAVDSTQVVTAPGTVAAGTTMSAPVVTVTGTPTNPTDAATVSYVGSHSSSKPTINPSTLNFFGDSNTDPTTAVPNQGNLTNWPARIAYAAQAPTTNNWAQSGTGACNAAAQAFTYDLPTLAAQQPGRFSMIGTNDAGVGPGAYEATFNLCNQAELTHLATPTASRSLASAATTSGTCGVDTTFTATAGKSCTAIGSAVTLGAVSPTVTSTVAVWYRMINSDTGTGSCQLDGAGTAYTFSTAPPSSMAAVHSTTTGPGVFYIPSVSAATHTIVCTQTTGGTMSILGAGWAPTGYDANSIPYVVDMDIINQLDGANQSNVNAYRADILANYNTVKGYGWNLIYVPTGQFVPMTTAAGDAFNSLHVNVAGGGEIAQSVQSTVNIVPAGLLLPVNASAPNSITLPGSTSYTANAQTPLIVNTGSGNTVTLPSTGIPLNFITTLYGHSTSTATAFGSYTVFPNSSVSLFQYSANNWLPFSSWNLPATRLAPALVNLGSSTNHTLTATDGLIFSTGTGNTVTTAAAGAYGNTLMPVYNWYNATGPLAVSGAGPATSIPVGGFSFLYAYGSTNWMQIPLATLNAPNVFTKPQIIPTVSNGVTTATNSDNRGHITLAAGTSSYTFTQGPGTAGIWTTAPVCMIQDDTTLANLATSTKTVTATALTITGSVGTTDTYSYICWPGN